MTLTGKAKTDFGIWHFERNTPIDEYKNFNSLSETCQNAVIIEWFDSVGIFITAKPSEHIKWSVNWQYSIRNHVNAPYKFKSREEAYSAAILVANEIYQIIQWKKMI